MNKKYLHKVSTLLIACVWLINGFFCKILNLVPRHQEILGKIIDSNYARELTIIIGILEIVMLIWIISKYQSKLNAITQITIVMLMNIIEIILIPDALLWGKFNIVFALLFVFTVYVNEFRFKKIA
ncbi:DoxX-like family protein [Tenacibaculum tangerinum]|uniref:DoxX-like family protein n=1 Tax=Tenacibaculum tangerinum TaxID=3038772 RepID=A0ABY8L1E6_9FLAO|nr:DoxX-like family protein [Tenacibaculum tangerinum]WGH75281.1 DoxX-like family protein [Tenacibaculum tangerinum]